MGLLSLGKLLLPLRGGFSLAAVKSPTLGELQFDYHKCRSDPVGVMDEFLMLLEKHK